jgi:class 3 adenylate cyclase
MGSDCRLARRAARCGRGRLSAGVAAGSAAERRQLTVTFCDLVGSTAIAARLIPKSCAK